MSAPSPRSDAEPEAWWTTEEVARHFRTAVSTVHSWKCEGRIKGGRVGRRVLYPLAEIRRLEALLRAEMDAR